MRVKARLLLDDGRRIDVVPGALVGRMPQATVRLDDPRVSEAHALISMRGAQLRLLALRGKISVDGKPRTDVILTPGQRIVVAGTFSLTVEAVELPSRVLAVQLCAPPWDVVGAHGVVALFPQSATPLRPGYSPEAAAHVWTRDHGSVLRRTHSAGEETDSNLEAGSTFEVDGLTFGLDWVDRDTLEVQPTTDLGHDQTRLKLILAYDSVRITADDGRFAVVDGIGARVLCELWEIRVPIGWQEVAKLIWPDHDTLSERTIRQRWDQLLTRIRMRLREAGLRSDLIRATNRGLVELAVGPNDTVEDLT
jgi:hypothetical protein